MNFEEIIKERQSVRRYNKKEVEEWKLDKCIEAVRLSPSACNAQPWKLIIVKDKELKTKVGKETIGLGMNKFAPEAQTIVVFVIEKPNFTSKLGWLIKNREFPLIDLGVAAQNFCNQATDLGLGTCMIGWFNEKNIKKLLNVPRSKRLGLVITIGYAPDDYKKRTKIRKAKEIMSSINKY
jgi:nitroreductase